MYIICIVCHFEIDFSRLPILTIYTELRVPASITLINYLKQTILSKLYRTLLNKKS